MGKRRRLKDSQDVARYLGNIALRLDAGEIAPEIATKLAYVLNILLKAIESGDLESRIAALEQAQPPVGK